MTLRLYHDSPALAFDAEVIGFDGEPTRVVLDRTAFYPTSGGQPHDTGVLGGARVLDVIDEEARIIHVVDAPLALGPVHGEVDAARRRDYTQQHTAQHLVSALAEDHFSWRTESVHFGEEHSTIEFDTRATDDEQLTTLLAAATDAIAAAIPVTVGYEDAASATGLRKPPPRAGTIRIVTIAGIDRSACGGTHVTTTAELGSLVWTGVERIRGRIRLGYLAGDRLRRAFLEQQRLLAALAGTAGTTPRELEELVPRRFEALRQAEKRIDGLEGELARYRIRELLERTPPGSGGVRRLVLHPGAAAVDALRQLGQAAAAESRVVFIATAGEPATVIVAASPDAGIHAGNALKAALAAAGGRGGGSASFAQGTVPEATALGTVVAALTS
jgi:alanyl-tRNA synthetase